MKACFKGGFGCGGVLGGFGGEGGGWGLSNMHMCKEVSFQKMYSLPKEIKQFGGLQAEFLRCALHCIRVQCISLQCSVRHPRIVIVSGQTTSLWSELFVV